MKKALDSAYPPNAAQLATAKQYGYTAWFGYFAGPNILHGWADADFQRVLAAGFDTMAYCSGWADPVAEKTRAAALGIPITLDDESGIRSLISPSNAGLVPETYVSANRKIARANFPNGEARPVLEEVDGKLQVSDWVQPWLDASGAGQYGNEPVFAGVHASRYVFAAYPGGTVTLTWPTYYPRPADGHPCAWQWQGTTTFAGIGVDVTNLDDDFFAFGPQPVPLTGDADMVYVGPLHDFGPVTLTVASDGFDYRDPFVVSNFANAPLVKGAGIKFDGLRYASTPVNGDYRMFHATSGQWVPGGYLNVVGISAYPAVPSATEKALMQLFGVGGLTLAQVDTEVANAIAKLPADVTPAEMLQAIAAALAAFKPTSALPTPHHHKVLSVIDTGPVVSDPS